MQINQAEPLAGFVQVKMEAVKAGVLDTSSKDSAVEVAEVVAVGRDCHDLKVGDRIFVKAWAVDNIFHDGEWYRFVHVDTKGILAKVHAVQ